MIIAVGANLPAVNGTSALQNCANAVRKVADLPIIRRPVGSRWYSTAPVPVSAQPRFVNGVLRAESDAAPAVLLAALQAIEQVAGRQRSVPDAARTLDLDIIDYGGRVQDQPDLTLPHPRAHLRAFVLYPLRDVMPGWTHPATGAAVQDLLGNLPEADVHPL